MIKFKECKHKIRNQILKFLKDKASKFQKKIGKYTKIETIQFTEKELSEKLKIDLCRVEDQIQALFSIHHVTMISKDGLDKFMINDTGINAYVNEFHLDKSKSIFFEKLKRAIAIISTILCFYKIVSLVIQII
jgi:hypothetical protein